VEQLQIKAHSIQDVDAALLLTPEGVIRARTSEQFRKHVEELLEQTRSTSVVIDFAGVDSIDSSAAGYLLNVHDRLSMAGGKLALAAMPASVRLVIDSIGLTTFFTVCATVDEAVQELG
jgi:anti-anti-sigma factor